jgi:hypothetical protein
MEVTTPWILRAHKKSYDRFSKNKTRSAPDFAVDGVCETFDTDSFQCASRFCNIDSATHQTGIEIANAGSPHGFTDIGSVCCDANPLL